MMEHRRSYMRCVAEPSVDPACRDPHETFRASATAAGTARVGQGHVSQGLSKFHRPLPHLARSSLALSSAPSTVPRIVHRQG